MSLPAADALFRPSENGQGRPAETEPQDDRDPAGDGGRRGRQPSGRVRPTADKAVRAVPDAAPEPEATEDGDQASPRQPSGRVRHDEKMTVYVTAAELLEIEHARLAMRSLHGVAVDRGRLVREAVAMALADLEANGDDSQLVQRLVGR